MVSQCCKRGYAAPVDVLIEIGVLTMRDYTEWRYGKVPYLERVCMGNLKGDEINHQTVSELWKES